MTKLKNCPFCGAEATTNKWYEGELYIDVFYIRCSNENCTARIKSRNKDVAIARWNRRVNNG